MTDVDRITIQATHSVEVDADAASLAVTVQGTSLVTGRAALSKAKEVRALVEALGDAGVDRESIRVETVRVDASSGLLTKSSSATYSLRVFCDDLEALPDVLGAIAAARNVELTGLRWSFPDDEDAQARWLARAVARANRRAAAAAAALGTRIVGVHRLTERPVGAPARDEVPAALGMQSIKRARGVAPVELGLSMTARRTTGVSVEVDYRVEGFAPSAAEG